MGFGQEAEAASELRLHGDEVCVWNVCLRVEAGLLEAYRSVLTQDEQERASRFVFDRDKRRFTVARGVLRVLLGRYLGLPPAAVRFRYNRFGKPSLGPEADPGGVHFNLSHSGESALLAFSCGRELGIDLEEVRPECASLSVARQFFSPCEQAELQGVDPALRPLAFFLCWTRKEAFVKAQGSGLSLPLDSFDVSLTPGEPPLLRMVRGEVQQADWHLVHLDAGPGFAAGLVGSGGPFLVKHMVWPTPHPEQDAILRRKIQAR